MGLTLLAPLFLIGLLAVAVPILVHLTARDRRDVVRFPSLRFLTRLPYRQVRRQRIRHPLLFALRTLAVVLLVLAFARPLLRGAAVGEGSGEGGEVVIALDRSYSMAYGDTWERAVRAARDAVEALPPGSRVSLLTFAEEARVSVVAAAGSQEMAGALDTLAPGSGRTRFAPVAMEYVPPHGRYSLDILTRLGEAFSWRDLAADSDRGELGDLTVRVASPRMLYRMKKDTVRPQDRADAARIRDAFDLEDE